MTAKTVRITNQLLEAFLRCKRKPSLLGEEELSSSEYLPLTAGLEREFRAGARQSLIERANAGATLQSPSTADQLTQGYEVILNILIHGDQCDCRLEALVRVPGESSLGEFHYQPVRFCRAERIERREKVLLAFAGTVVGAVQGTTPEHGLIIHGPKHMRSRVRLENYRDDLSIAMDQLRDLVRSSTIPPPFLNSHCDVCAFRDRCRNEALDTDHLSLLKGITEKEVGRHNSRGIFTVHQLSHTFRAKRRSRRARPGPPPHSYALQALAKRQKQVFVYGTPSVPSARVNVYFDIEGIPDRNFYYLIGVVIEHDGRSEDFSFWADEKSEEEAIFRSFVDTIPAHDAVRLFHFGSYESVAIRRMMGRMTVPYQDRLREIQSSAVNVLSIIRHHFYFPVFSNSLKEVAATLGITWTDAGSTGLQSIVWRNEWEKTRDHQLKNRLYTYNRDDCLALRRVTEFMRNAISELTKQTTAENMRLPVSTTDSLRSSGKKSHEFGSIEFAVPELDVVNRCAYFDYQGEKVYVRTNPELRRINRARRVRKRRLRPNKVLEISSKKCPLCRSKKISKRRAIKRQVIDLRFGKGSVKKWITWYRSWRYACGKCSHIFIPPAVPDSKTKYGHGLASWCVYNHIVCGQNMSRIRRGLKDIFDLDLPQSAIWRFKKSIRDLLQPHSARILEDLVCGPVLHADETEVKLRASKGYVWVFASMNRV